jgi:hypothetical protein
MVTFVGQGNGAPAFAPVAGQRVNAGWTLRITNSVTDPDMPGQTLTFTLLSAPAGASLVPLDDTNALFTWRPLLEQSGTTNAIQVKVTDSGTPSLSATNRFIITVIPASLPTLGSIALGGGQVTLTATGMIGPDYTLLTSTNLVNWLPLLTTNPTVIPVAFEDTNRSHAVRFYRLRLGP